MKPTLKPTIRKLFVWGKGDSGGHVLREMTSRGLCGLVCPSRTSERGESYNADPVVRYSWVVSESSLGKFSPKFSKA